MPWITGGNRRHTAAQTFVIIVVIGAAADMVLPLTSADADPILIQRPPTLSAPSFYYCGGGGSGSGIPLSPIRLSSISRFSRWLPIHTSILQGQSFQGKRPWS